MLVMTGSYYFKGHQYLEQVWQGPNGLEITRHGGGPQDRPYSRSISISELLRRSNVVRYQPA